MMVENGARIVTSSGSLLENSGATLFGFSSAMAAGKAAARTTMRTIRSGVIVIDWSVAQVVKVYHSHYTAISARRSSWTCCTR